MRSTSEPSTGSPISRVPCEILREIFIHCLPQYPLRGYGRPCTPSAPMVLCRICSAWRTIALAFPTLWAHLSYDLTIIMEDDYNIDTGSGSFKFVAREIQLLRWWRMNQGSIAPLLILCARESYPEDINPQLVADATQDGMDFLFEYILSAQSLQLETFYWLRIEEKITAGYQVIFPNLCTLLWEEESSHATDTFDTVLALSSKHAFPALRHLSIGQHAQLDNSIIPNLWSMPTLTHVFLWASISLDFWFSFIRAVPNLRWGYFDISTLHPIDYTVPRKSTLFQLTTLFVRVSYSLLPDILGLPLSLLFTNLHLPALDTLSLHSSTAKSWKDHRAITELYGVLKSTPIIKNLSLEGNFLSFRTHNTVEVLAAVEDIQPIWSHAPQLSNLQFHLPIWTFEGDPHEVIKAGVDLFIRNVFSCDRGWLDLRNPACPIRTLTINDNGSDYPLRDSVMASMQNNADKAPNVILQMTTAHSESIAVDVQDEWASIV